MKPSDIIELFNDGEWEKISKLFNNSILTFLNFSLKKGFSNRLDIAQIPWREFEDDDNLFGFLANNGFLDDINYDNLNDDLKNYYLDWWLETNPELALQYVVKQLLDDVEIREDGYWLRLRDREELSIFFKTYSRDTSPYDLAKSLFSENDDWFDRWGNTTDNVYRDVIEDLDDSNTQILAKYIMTHIGNQDLQIEDYSSEFFHEIHEEQGGGDFFKIRDEDVYYLIKDEEAMMELLNGDLEDLKSELYSVHNNAYNNAFQSECYDLVYDGLGDFFSSRIVDEEQQRGENKKWVPYIKIKNLYNDVLTFVNDNKGCSYSDCLLEYHSSYTEMMRNLFDADSYEEISFRIPEYPDWDLTTKYINEFFSEYI